MRASMFLHPRYWLVWLGYWMLWVVVRLPHMWRIRLGSGLGLLGFVATKSRRHIVETNLRYCFPSLDDKARNALSKDIFRSGGISIVETAIAWLGKEGSVVGRCTFDGLDNLKRAHGEGRGVILLGVHMSTLDIAGGLLARQARLDVMYRANKNPLIEYLMTSGRGRLFPDTIERADIRTVIKNLKAGHIVWYGPDQDYGARNSDFASFFGVQAATTTAPSRLAKITGARVVPFAHYRENGGATYRLEMLPPLEDFPGPSFEADALRINQLIERAVRQYPDQYWWFHRRFKTRPSGEASLY